MRLVAVDWSGRATGAERCIWTALVEEDRLSQLLDGQDRPAVGDHLVNQALARPDLVVGLDFGFSFPLWFLDREGLRDGLDVPEEMAERWLAECPRPFWGRPGRPRGPEPQLRRTEREAGARAGSVFQLGGAGSVGTGSLRGLPLLRRLRREGFAIWPFDAPAQPLVVEIFPRLLTGPVVKSRAAARSAYLEAREWPAAAAVSEHAFDAAVSALVMGRWRHQLAGLAPEPDPVLRREGRIWVGSAGGDGRGGQAG